MNHRHPNQDELILSIDAGTQSIRAALVELRGRIRLLVKTPLAPCLSPQPGWAEQRPEYYWETLCLTTRELFRQFAGDPASIRAVALTTQRGTVIDVDRDGKPLRPAILWLDERKADERGIVPGAIRRLLRLVRLDDLVLGVVRDCESNWLRQHQPEIWERTHKHLFLSGYLTYRLIGEFVDSRANIVGYLPFNIRRGEWSGPHDIKWRLFPIERDKLPRLAAPTEELGRIDARVSEETGIPRGLPLFACANDKACEILGAGCLGPADACLSLGTISTVNVPNDKYVEIRTLWPPFPAAVPGSFYTEVPVMRGAWMISWFKEEFGLPERQEARDRCVSAEQLLDRLIRDVPPGSLGLVLQPYWTPSFDKAKSARGSIIGFCDLHKRAHLYRAILEGLMFALKDGARLLEKKNQTSFGLMRVSGGASQSDAAMQICADIFGMPAQRPHTHETSALGAAIDAAVGLGMYADFPQAVKAMTRVGAQFEPVPAHVEVYRALYERVYRRMYQKLTPLFDAIRKITGYPE